MNKYSTIKELVIETCISEGQFPSYEKLTSLVMQCFPDSKWKKTHYSWYKSKIKTGVIEVPGFSADEEDEEQIESKEFAFEKDLRNYLSKNLNEIESGLKLYEEDEITGIEFPVGGRFIDILAVDKNNDFAIIELKVSKGYDRAIGQLLRYIGWVEENLAESNQSVRGIIVASNISEDLLLATKRLPGIALYEYEMSFSLKKIKT